VSCSLAVELEWLLSMYAQVHLHYSRSELRNEHNAWCYHQNPGQP
jgi:hypothetical protein